MIDGQAVLAGQPADAAGGGQPADPDPAVVPGAERPTVRRERRGDVHPARTRLDPHAAGLLVGDLDRIHPGQIDDDAAVVGRPATDPVAPTADGQRNVLNPRKSQRVDDLVGRSDL